MPNSDQPISEELISQFPRQFNGIGKLNDTEVHLHIDESVTPVVQPARCIPFHLQKQVAEVLNSLEHQGTTEKVESATPWVIVFGKTQGKH